MKNLVKVPAILSLLFSCALTVVGIPASAAETVEAGHASQETPAPGKPARDPAPASEHHAPDLEAARDIGEHGGLQAQLYLGWAYLKGDGVPRDEAEAAKWYRKAAERGNDFAEWMLGGLYLSGNGVTKDDTEAAIWILKSAQQGNANAQHDIGLLYMHGRGVPQAAGAAYFWLTLAAEGGVKGTEAPLAECAKHLTSDQISQDEAKAKDWKPTPETPIVPKADKEAGIKTDAAAEKEAPKSAVADKKSPPVKKTPEDPAKLKTAAEQGDPDAELNLGLAYEIGHGVPQDQKTAAAWFSKAADQGVAGAQRRLGVLFERGHGVPQDSALAAKWYRRAADQGDAEAQFNLFVLYQEGNGVSRDNAEALFWLTLAGKSNPVYTAPSLVTKANKSLTPEQAEAVQKRVSEWKPTPAASAAQATP